MRKWNDFCKYCTDNKIENIRECTDIGCPFYPFRRGGLDQETEQSICKTLIKEVMG